MSTEVHWAMSSGRTAGAPWCRSDPSVAAEDLKVAVTTTFESEVTCEVCLAHLRRANEAARDTVDWFGEGED